jgi:dephospho-CoA kinase
MNRKPVLGLIGGIGSGKSCVAAELVRHGAYLISGDQLGHEALRQPGIRQQVVRRWGEELLNTQGEIDRRKLGAIVFGDPAQLRYLETLSFPWIERRMDEEIAAAQADPKVALVVVDAAILLEAGWDHRCDRLVFVDAPRAVRLERLRGQRGWTEKEVQARESAQMSLTAKAARADYVVDNSGSSEHLAAQVRDLLRRVSANHRPGTTSR